MPFTKHALFLYPARFQFSSFVLKHFGEGGAKTDGMVGMSS